jgi:FixJ family two-component response regulator
MAVRGSLTVVIVVDDDQGMREAIESLLIAAGFGAVVYASAEAMLAAGVGPNTLCVITDVHLPGMSGLELIGELRARGCQQKVIVITGYDSPAGSKEAERLGAAAYFAKPFAASALLGVINELAEPLPLGA